MAKMANKLMGAKANPAPKKGARPGLVPVPDAGRAGRGMSEERRYRAEDALHAISKAHEHMGDKKLMGDVKKVAAERAQHYADMAKKC